MSGWAAHQRHCHPQKVFRGLGGLFIHKSEISFLFCGGDLKSPLLGIWLNQQLLLCREQRRLPRNDKDGGQPTGPDAGLSFKDIQPKPFSHRIESTKTPSQGCPKVSRESLLLDNHCQLQQTKCLILASSEWHGDNYRGGPHRNSLDAPFSMRQCDYYVKNPVSYFYHICCRSSCQCIHGEVITSHSRKIGWRPTDWGREGGGGGHKATPPGLCDDRRCARMPEIEIREDKGIYDYCVRPKRAVVLR